MKLLPAVAALAFVGLALPATATPPVPNMLAQATLQPGGVAVAWSAPGAQVDGYVVQRSHAGLPFTAIATVGSGTFSFLDGDGDVSDIYLVDAVVQEVHAFTSNPAPVLLIVNCPWFTGDTPPDVNCECFPCPG
ncbi:MAG: hypothetical protein ABR586_04915 [Thermoplasmatota archaeon]